MLMDGTKVFIDGTVLEQVDRSNPPGLTRTAWVALLLQIGMVNAPRLSEQQQEQTDDR